MKVHKPFNLINLLLVLLVGVFFVSCGSDDDSEDNPQQEETTDDQGTYEAVLNPLNALVAGSPSGTATVRIRGDEVKVNLSMRGTPPGIFHRQHIYAGRSCPTPANDTNGDGLIDFSESLAATSSILIPLDNELRTQLAGGVFPLSNRSGNYSYVERAPLSFMLSDLRASDPIPSDNYSKLAPDENLNLPGRAVMIHGISSDASLPIACGILIRVAEPEPTPIPVPVPSCPVETQFETRLTTDLLIGGIRCHGGETTEYDPPGDGPTQIFTCLRGQWLVTVDNINTCTVDGICTEVEVLPVIANLVRTNGSKPPQYCQYGIRPISPIGSEQRKILFHYQVRFSSDQGPVVLPKGN